MTPAEDSLSIVVIGASGDLARKKIFPALFALYSQGRLPENVHFYGFARSAFSPDEFRNRLVEHLTCRYVPGASCAEWTNRFLSRCHYVSGQYASRESFLDLYEVMRARESSAATNRLFYLAITPSVFLEVVHALAGAGLVHCGIVHPWSRVVIEKPFGRDRESSDRLTHELTRIFTENQTFRIDHYLGKEMVQNLMILRFANLVFEPVWNRASIDTVCIDWAEDIGVGDRGGYYDQYGIIRDMMQNHLLQILALVAMEQPSSTQAGDIQNEKTRVLKAIPPLTMDHLALGQYIAAGDNPAVHPGYRQEDGIRDDSLTPTAAFAVLHVSNARWDGVPFLISAGKALDRRMSEVRIHFRHIPADIFCHPANCLPTNDLVVRIQPDEALFLKIVTKQPGLDFSLVESELNLRYQSVFPTQIPDAYERLLLDVIEGDKGLFIRSDELEAAWDIVTPVLHEIDHRRVAPEPYPFGSSPERIGAALRQRYEHIH